MVTPPANVKAPVLPAIEATEPADAIDDTEARLIAPDAALSPIMMSSPAAGEAFSVNAAKVENCGAAEPAVKLPSNVNAAALACLATVTALLAIVIAWWVPDGYMLLWAMMMLILVSVCVVIGGISMWWWRRFLSELH